MLGTALSSGVLVAALTISADEASVSLCTGLAADVFPETRPRGQRELPGDFAFLKPIHKLFVNSLALFAEKSYSRLALKSYEC